MYKLARAEDIKAMDALALESLHITARELISRAADAFVAALQNDGIMRGVKSVLIICGRGNNGADGRAIAALLAHMHYDITVACPFDETFEFDPSKYDIIIDALLGTGFKGNFDERISALMGVANASECKRVAVDIPSGAVCDTGAVCENCFRADLTITFEFMKPACVSYPAHEYFGRIICVSIGFTDEIRAVVTGNPYAPVFVESVEIKPREKNTHKGYYGTVLAVCGSEFMTGAAYFAAMGALRCGAGLVHLAAPRPALPILQAKLNEPVFMPSELVREKFAQTNFNSVLFGCGCGRSAENAETLKYLAENCKCPLILDADGINLLAENIYILKTNRNIILTPHPAEFARLTDRAVGYVQSNRLELAKSFAAEHGCVVVLKGARTVTASPDGRVAVNGSGNAGMAKGGSGDILAGMAASLCAQRDTQGWDIFGAAVTAAYIHGAAGDLCAGETSEAGMLPSDILDKIPLFFKT